MQSVFTELQNQEEKLPWSLPWRSPQSRGREKTQKHALLSQQATCQRAPVQDQAERFWLRGVGREPSARRSQAGWVGGWVRTLLFRWSSPGFSCIRAIGATLDHLGAPPLPTVTIHGSWAKRTTRSGQAGSGVPTVVRGLFTEEESESQQVYITCLCLN